MVGVNEYLISLYFRERYNWDGVKVYSFDLDNSDVSGGGIMVRMCYGWDDVPHLRKISIHDWNVWYVGYRDGLISSIID